MRAFKISIIALALLVFGLSSCNKNPGTATSAIANIVQQASWRITLFNNSGTDETNQFTGYVFTFNSGGVVAAVKNSAATNGTWVPYDSQQKINLNFGTTGQFSKLNSDWHILEQTSAKLRLEDVSGGGGGTDLLTFEKN